MIGSLKLLILILALSLGGINSQIANVQYSTDKDGNSKPNYCRKKACIRCVDMGQYFGCEKCIYHDTRTTDMLRCDDMTIQERESKL